ncbi:EAL and HDOD domain-containing protein [Vibrio hepatarius]|uniref:EAL and HDOD domain-containing protein n=1 Tax=Vibrio hepatarius TaxID=171383 RepID=UPI001C08B985|nr:HDOD domain-containing protein [Vibrio hepatarius]MBU2899047.1 HDOD domain-containing protein [Vibrio hepatarius]
MNQITTNTRPNKVSVVARQPIIDINKELFAFELLYREGDTNSFNTPYEQRATMRLLSEQFLTFQKRNLNDKKGFVNFEYIDLIEGVPCDFSPDDIVVEVLETCSPTQELFDAIVDLKQKNYLVALDDFVPTPAWNRFYPLVDFIKLDVRELSFKDCAGIIRDFKNTDIQFIAEKVENHQEFIQAQKCGFHLFQGYFYQKPEVIKTQKLTASAMDIFKLSALVAKKDIDLLKVNKIVERNPVLSVQLLNFVNSDSRVSSRIESTMQALSYLGGDRVRKYVTYSMASALSPSKPSILVRNLLTRAKLMECLSQYVNDPSVSESAYLCGMLSLIEGLLDMALKDVLASLTLSDSIVSALVNNEGALGDLLGIAEAIERSDWKTLEHLQSRTSIDDKTIMTCLDKANNWINDFAA